MKTKIISGVLAFLALIGMVALTVKRVLQPPSFCDQCVMERETVAWRAFNRWELFRSSTIHATPVSDLLEQQGDLSNHSHQWSDARYLTQVELETADAPRVRSLGLLNAPRAVNFLRGVFAYTDAANLASWRTVAWQVDFASALEPALRFTRFPESGFSNREEFLAWWNHNSYPLFNRIHEMIEAD